MTTDPVPVVPESSPRIVTKGSPQAILVRAVLVLLWTATILYMTLSSDPSQSKTVGWLSDLCVSVGVPKQAPAKAFHFIAYAIWVWLVADLLAEKQMRLRTKLQVGLTLVLLTVLASGQETLQFLNASRHPSLIDVLINTAGGVTCLVARVLMSRRANSSPVDAVEVSV